MERFRNIFMLGVRLQSLAITFTVMTCVSAHAQLFVSAQDGKSMLIDGAIQTVEGEDSLALIELAEGQATVKYEIPVPTSVTGPPLSVDATPDGAIAIVTAGFKRDPSDPKKTVNDDRISVVDLTSQPPKLIETLHAGKGPAGISISRDGKLALVANHDEGTVSIFSICGKKVEPIEKISLNDAKAGPMHVAITPDGKRALVSRDGDHRVTLLEIEGTKVTVTKRDIYPGQRPDAVDIAPKGDVAVVANIGKGQGDTDTVSLIDLSLNPPRVMHTLSVGQTPEGVLISPDGRYAGVTVMNGSNKASNSPFFNPNGKFILLRIDGGTLIKVAEAPIGSWSQGLAFSPDGRFVLIQNSAQREIQILAVENEQIKDTGQRLRFKAAPVALRAIRR
jgi:DNA-binding beta-propeller fold protein YncE